ncbi:MAG: hypothetical protein KHZ87_05675 [Clostridiales bacterium]|nr:hypothetical protein [Clostridiales bacterium]MBS5877262.1 hypothetical protein [Clostridiales bacterium]
MAVKKEITDEIYNGLHRIKYINDNGTEVLGGYVYDLAQITDNAKVYDSAEVYDNAVVSDNAKVYGDAAVYDNAKVYGDALVSGNAKVKGNAKVQGQSKITTTSDYLVIGPIGSRDDFITFTNSDDGILATVGCFHGTINEFKKKVNQLHWKNANAKAYLLACELAELRING